MEQPRGLHSKTCPGRALHAHARIPERVTLHDEL